MVKRKWYQKSRFFRYLTQGFIFIFILDLVLSDVFKASENAVTISPEAYCPLGGLETLYRFFTEGKTLSHLHTSNVIILGLIVLITLLFRSGFCGWLCPFGTIQDLIRGFGRRIGNLPFMIPMNKKYKKLIKKNSSALTTIDKYARYTKYLVLLWAVLGAFYYVDLVFRDYDPFVALIKVTELESYTGVGILLVVMFLSLFVDRPWCRYTCPLGAAVGVMGKVSPLKVKRNEALCINCNLCTKSCPMNIEVSTQNHVKSLDCNQCLECVDVCPVKGALNLKLVMPWEKIQQPSHSVNSQSIKKRG